MQVYLANDESPHASIDTIKQAFLDVNKLSIDPKHKLTQSLSITLKSMYHSKRRSVNIVYIFTLDDATSKSVRFRSSIGFLISSILHRFSTRLFFMLYSKKFDQYCIILKDYRSP